MKTNDTLVEASKTGFIRLADDEEPEGVNDGTMPMTPGVGIGSYVSLLGAESAYAAEQSGDPADGFDYFFEIMCPFRHVFFDLITFCEQERSADEIDGKLDELLKHRISIYSNVALRRMLTDHGLLKCTTSEREAEPGVDDVDAEGNLILVPSFEGKWVATEAALKYRTQHTPEIEIAELIEEKDPDWATTYLKLLEFCEGGVPTSDIDKLFAEDPSLGKTSLYKNECLFPGYYVGNLEDTGGLYWSGKWETTAAGRAYLEKHVA